MRPLFPSIDWIERQMFSPTERLLERLASNDPGVPEELRDAASNDRAAQEALRELEQADLAAAGIQSAGEPPPMPPALRELAERRDAARAARAQWSLKPAQGQVVRIDRVIGPEDEIPWDLGQPLAVLLDHTTELPEVWRGWMVASETDYATDWDMLLEAEVDEPFDPLAGMVQVWNPVEVYIPSTSVVLAELKPARLAAVRALADEWLLAEDRPASEARPGRVFPRATLGGLRVLTGTTLAGPQDPRWRYQELYHAVTGAVTEPARLAWLSAAAAARRREFTAWAGHIADWVRQPRPGGWVAGVAAPATLGETPERQPALELRGKLRVTFFAQGDIVRAHLELLGDEPLIVRQISDGEIHGTCKLGGAVRRRDMWLTPEDDCLRVFDAADNQLTDLPLGFSGENRTP